MYQFAARSLLAASLVVVASAAWHPARAEDAAPMLPPYFTASSANPEAPTWLDRGGGAAGVWATPAGDGKGDVPAFAVHPSAHV